jgi:selenocysteine-specific elongation factor
VIIGTAGHIDHGKTALVKALTGVDTDRLPEEKRRGITVELGFAPIDLGGGITASVIDVPGHEAFVKTMVAGAAGIDVALLVIAADEGMMPQTMEHLAILELLEIPKLVVALTKTDLVDGDWLALVAEEVAAHLADSRWTSPAIVPCSAVSGEGIAEVRAALASVTPGESGRPDDLFRLPVDRCFTIKGTGTVATGTVWSGELSSDSVVRMLPAENSARVRRLQRHGVEVPRVGPGDRAAIALAGVEVADVPRGSTLVADQHWTATGSFDASVTFLGARSIHVKSRSELRVHLAGADVGGTLIFADDSDGDPLSAFARLKLDSPIAARGGDRFVLRLPSPVGTIGGGVVLDPYPGTRSASESRNLFSRESAVAPRSRLEILITASAGSGLELRELPVRIGVSSSEISRLLADLGCVVYNGRAYPAASLSLAKERILAAAALAEKTFPLDEGVQFESAINAAGCDPDLARLAIAELAGSGSVVARESWISRPGWKPRFTDAHQKTLDALAHVICSRGNEPPTAGELTKEYGGDVPVLLRYLEREGRVVNVGADRFYAPEAVAALIEKLRTDLAPGKEYGPSQLREALGFSRKYLIPFLEYCDRSGITERKGDGRTLRGV